MLAIYYLFSVLLTPTSFLAFGQLGTYDDGGPCDSCLNNLYNICGGTDSSGFATCLCTGASDQLIPCEATCAMESSFYLAAIVSDWTGFCAVYGPEAQSQPASSPSYTPYAASSSQPFTTTNDFSFPATVTSASTPLSQVPTTTLTQSSPTVPSTSTPLDQVPTTTLTQSSPAVPSTSTPLDQVPTTTLTQPSPAMPSASNPLGQFLGSAAEPRTVPLAINGIIFSLCVQFLRWAI